MSQSGISIKICVFMKVNVQVKLGSLFVLLPT